MSTTATDARPSSIGEFRVGSVISRSFGVLFGNLGQFAILSLIVAAPTFVAVMFGAIIGLSGASTFAIIWGVLVGLLSVVLAAVSQAAIVYGAFMALRGRPLQLGASFQRGFVRLWPVVLTSLLFTLGLGLGMMLLVVPGVILACRWFVSLPACVVEGTGPTSSLGRSAALTQGHRWKIFGIFLVCILFSVVASNLLQAIAVPLLGAIVGTLVSLVWQSFAGLVYAVAVVVTYHDLRVVKEGVDIDQIASVFD